MQNDKPQPGGVRLSSTRLILDALRRSGPSSQAGIARQTGLSRATVNNLVQRLLAQEMIDLGQANGRESIISLRSNKGAFVAVEVHPREIRSALFDFRAEQRWDATLLIDEFGEETTTPALAVAIVEGLVLKAGMSVEALSGIAVAIDAPIMRDS